MALNNLAGLKASALAWIERSGDPAAETIIDDCVTLCEARVNKTPTFRMPEMETEGTLYLVNGTAQLPVDFLAMKRVVANASSPRLLAYAEPGWYAEAFPSSGTDEGCGFYTIAGTLNSPSSPSPGGGAPTVTTQQTLRSKASSTLGIVYYARVPSLAATDPVPNWLLVKSPDIYLYGTILELLVALEGESQDKYAGLFGSAIESLVAAQTYSRGGVLTQRASMPAP
jgi:hypothetical protein